MHSFVVERDLRDVVVAADGSLYVSSFRAAEVLHLERRDNAARDPLIQAALFRPQVAWRMVAGPADTLCVVHQEHSLTSLSTKNPGGYGGFAPGSGAVFSALSVLGADGIVQNVSTLVGVLPVDIAISPDGSTAAVVFAADGLNSALPDITFTPLANATPPSGTALDGAGFMSFTGSSSEYSVKIPELAGTEAIAVSYDAAGELLVQTRDGTLRIFDPMDGTTKGITLSTTPRDDTGHDIFHAAAGALVACASCHPEGGDDSHVWTFDGNERRTPSLRGTVAGTAPYHWPGDERDFNQLTNDLQSGRMMSPSRPIRSSRSRAGWRAFRLPLRPRGSTRPRRRAGRPCSKGPRRLARRAIRARSSRTTSPSTSGPVAHSRCLRWSASVGERRSCTADAP